MIQNMMNFEEVMRQLRVNRSTLFRLIETGQLTAYKIGRVYRFKPTDVEACYLELKDIEARSQSREVYAQ
jgi:excisionase family DNA binding protein